MLLQQIFNGLALGMGYALIAVGYSLVFGICLRGGDRDGFYCEYAAWNHPGNSS